MENENQVQNQVVEQNQQQQQAATVVDRASFFNNDETFGEEGQQQQKPATEEAKVVAPEVKELEGKVNDAKKAYEADPTNVQLKESFDKLNTEYTSKTNTETSIFDEFEEVKSVNTEIGNQKQVYTNIAKKLNLTIEGEIDEDTFVRNVNDKIAEASTKIELDKTKYAPEVAELFDYVETGGDPKELINPLSGIIDFMALTSEQKIRFVLKNNGKNDIEIQQKIDELTEQNKIDEMGTAYMKNALELRNKAISDTVAKHKDRVAAYNENEKQRNERITTDILKVLPNMDSFMGEKLSEQTKAYLKSQAVTGNILKTFLNNPEALLRGFMYDKFGDKVFEKLKGSTASAAAQSHKAGVETVKAALHNNIPKEEGSAGGTNRNTSTDGKSSFNSAWGQDGDL